MNKNRAYYSAMGSMTNIESYNASVRDRDLKTFEIKKSITDKVLLCSSEKSKRRELFLNLISEFPLYESEISQIIQEYWS